MDSQKIRAVEDAVARSFSRIEGEEYAFLGPAQSVILSRLPLFQGIAERIRRRITIEASLRYGSESNMPVVPCVRPSQGSETYTA